MTKFIEVPHDEGDDRYTLSICVYGDGNRELMYSDKGNAQVHLLANTETDPATIIVATAKNSFHILIREDDVKIVRHGKAVIYIYSWEPAEQYKWLEHENVRAVVESDGLRRTYIGMLQMSDASDTVMVDGDEIYIENIKLIERVK